MRVTIRMIETRSVIWESGGCGGVKAERSGTVTSDVSLKPWSMEKLVGKLRNCYHHDHDARARKKACKATMS